MIVCPAAGMRRGARKGVPLVLGLLPFGMIAGIVSQSAGLGPAATAGMAGIVYAGTAQLVALSAWSHPAPILGSALAALVLNARYVLMGPALAPWLDGLRGWRLLVALGVMVDHALAMSIADMRSGGRDVGFYLGVSGALYVSWVTASLLGYAAGDALRPAPGHPIFFAATAAFVTLLVSLWRGPHELAPWAIAGSTAYAVHWTLPGRPYYIAIGAIVGALAGAAMERRRG